MGIKILILEACFIAGEDGSVPAEVGDTPEVTKDEASLLTRIGRALYTERGDDHSKGLLTATDDVVKAAKKRAQVIKADREAAAKAAAASTPAGQADLIAAIVKATIEAQAAAAAAPKA